MPERDVQRRQPTHARQRRRVHPAPLGPRARRPRRRRRQQRLLLLLLLLLGHAVAESRLGADHHVRGARALERGRRDERVGLRQRGVRHGPKVQLSEETLMVTNGHHHRHHPFPRGAGVADAGTRDRSGWNMGAEMQI